jgi:hypothetical protein
MHNKAPVTAAVYSLTFLIIIMSLFAVFETETPTIFTRLKQVLGINNKVETTTYNSGVAALAARLAALEFGGWTTLNLGTSNGQGNTIPAAYGVPIACQRNGGGRVRFRGLMLTNTFFNASIPTDARNPIINPGSIPVSMRPSTEKRFIIPGAAKIADFDQEIAAILLIKPDGSVEFGQEAGYSQFLEGALIDFSNVEYDI